jgi:hypothetical protein
MSCSFHRTIINEPLSEPSHLLSFVALGLYADPIAHKELIMPGMTEMYGSERIKGAFEFAMHLHIPNNCATDRIPYPHSSFL